MRAAYSIASRDFKANIFSLKGASIMFFFMIILGVFFQSFVYTFVEMIDQAPSMGVEAPSMDRLVQAVFHNLNFILLLALPAITMASFSEEKKSKLDRLLLSSPVRPAEIVLGKFLASLGIVCSVLLGSSVYMIFLCTYGNPDPGLILSSYLGIHLLSFSHIAFGLWVSALTSHQFLSFIFTMGGLLLMLILNWIAPNISSSDGLEGFIKYLASSTHLEPFLKGSISISHSAYFLLVTILFLFLSTLQVESERWK